MIENLLKLGIIVVALFFSRKMKYGWFKWPYWLRGIAVAYAVMAILANITGISEPGASSGSPLILFILPIVIIIGAVAGVVYAGRVKKNQS